MKKSVSDSTLNRLWSKAVIAKYKRCPVSGDIDDLQAHHIVHKGRQNRFAIRWDIRNGVPLSPGVHRALHDSDIKVQKQILEYVEERGDIDYLIGLKHMLKHDFLAQLGMTENEYRIYVKNELTEIIKGEI